MATNSGSLSAQALDRLVESRLQFLKFIQNRVGYIVHAKHREGKSRLPAVHVQRMVVWIVSAVRPRGTESQLRLLRYYAGLTAQ